MYIPHGHLFSRSKGPKALVPFLSKVHEVTPVRSWDTSGGYIWHLLETCKKESTKIMFPRWQGPFPS
jgi:hypothetical protein